MGEPRTEAGKRLLGLWLGNLPAFGADIAEVKRDGIALAVVLLLHRRPHPRREVGDGLLFWTTKAGTKPSSRCLPSSTPKPPPESSPTYRRDMRDAGRGGLIR